MIETRDGLEAPRSAHGGARARRRPRSNVVSAALVQAVERVSKTVPDSRVRRDTIREHLFGMLEPRRFERSRSWQAVSFWRSGAGEALGIMGRNGCGQEHAAEDPLRRLSAGHGTRQHQCGASRRSWSLASAGIPSSMRSTTSTHRFGHGTHAPRHPAQHGRNPGVRRARAVRQLKLQTLLERHVLAAGATPSRSRRSARCWCSTKSSRSAMPGFRAACEERYRQLHAAGHTVVLVSHDPRIVSAFC